MSSERALAPITDLQAITSGLPALEGLGKVLAQSGYFKDTSDSSKAIVKVLYGSELGIGPIQAMMGIHVIEGKPAMSAGLMSSLIKASGRYTWRVLEHTDKVCRLMFMERNGDGWMDVGESAFTMEDAKRANLSDRTVWKSYPKNMMFARALSNGAKWFCADVFGGSVYEPDELQNDAPAPVTPLPNRRAPRAAPVEAEVIDVTPTTVPEQPSAAFRERLEPAVAAAPPDDDLEEPPTDPDLLPIGQKAWDTIVDTAAAKGITYDQITALADAVCGIPVDEFAWEHLTRGQAKAILKAIKER